jgi:hypothetical protein
MGNHSGCTHHANGTENLHPGDFGEGIRVVLIQRAEGVHDLARFECFVFLSMSNHPVKYVIYIHRTSLARSLAHLIEHLYGGDDADGARLLCRDIHCESSYTVYGYPQWITCPERDIHCESSYNCIWVPTVDAPDN